MTFVSRKGSDICIAIIPKCGNTSIHTAVSCDKYPLILTNEQSLDYKNRVAFIRHPIDRVHSVFFNARGVISQDKGWCGLEKKGIYVEGRGLQGDYEAFIDYILNNDDVHWKPQAETISHNNKLIPNIFHPLTELDFHYNKYFKTGQRISHSNSWSREPIEAYRSQDLKEMYKSDFDLWGSLWL